MAAHWEPGELIVRREVLGLGPGLHSVPKPAWHGSAWQAVPVFVVEDTTAHLVTYIPEGAEMGFVDGDWPTPDGRHPWHRKTHWEGHGCLMVQRPGDPFAVWHFWTGADREFRCWYINVQADFMRTTIGYDTQDFELDIVAFPDGAYIVKDLELLDDRVTEGRFTIGLANWIRELGAELTAELDAGRHWWDNHWAHWTPPKSWKDPRLPHDWRTAT